jgi:hypothetical protein
MTKRAICVGINQYADRSIPPLVGCVADARAMAATLGRMGFDSSDVKLLVDDRATRENVLRALDWGLLSSVPGDTVVLDLACFGTVLADLHGGSLDEVYVLHDHSFAYSQLRDDEVADRLARLPAGVQAVVIVDGGRLAPLPPPTGPALFGAPLEARGRFLSPPADQPALLALRTNPLPLAPRLRARRPGDAPVVAIHACAEDAVAGETPAGGHFTRAFAETLGGGGGRSWSEIVQQTAAKIQASGVAQSPTCEGGEGAAGSAGPVAGAVGMGGTDMVNAPVPVWSPAPAPGATPPGYAAPGYAAPGYVPVGAAPGHVPVGAAPAYGPGATALVAPPAGGAPGSAMISPAASTGPGFGAMAGGALLAGGALAGGALAGGMALASKAAQSFAPAATLDEALLAFHESDVTARVCHALFAAVPFAPRLAPYRSLDDVIQTLYPQADSTMIARARELAGGPGAHQALRVLAAIDAADSGIALFSGLKGALGLFRGQGGAAFETDTQQGVDAALKLLAMSYFIHLMYPGPIPGKVQLFATTPAGQHLAIFYGLADIALPFADNVATGAGNLVGGLLNRHGGDAASKLAGALGGQAAGEAQGVVGSLLGPIEGIVQRVVPHARDAAHSAAQFLPGALNVVDKVAGVVATGLDALPVYKYLGARVVAESCVLLASRGL